jgi:hypothetical protein
MRIKALTLWEPWASLVAIGAKRFETRDWGTKYRGWLAIHAAKRWRQEQRDVVLRAPYAEVLQEAGFHVADRIPFDLGCVVAVVKLTGIYEADAVAQQLQPSMPTSQAGEHELAFGDFRAGRRAWHLQDTVRLERPVAARGTQGLWWWDVPPGLESLLTQSEPRKETSL